MVYIIGIESCRVARDEEKAAAERKKTVIVGDMQPLSDALPTLSNEAPIKLDS